MVDYSDKVGQVVNFAKSDNGDYSVLIEEAKGSKIAGLILSFSSCYPSATFPDSSIPTIHREKFDLADSDIAEYGIRFREATVLDKMFEADAAQKQNQFLKTMICSKNPDDHVYQSLTFDILQSKESKGAGVYCDLKMQNLVGIESKGVYRNPYVVNNDIVADSLNHMETAYDRYSSVTGVVTPNTNITYNVTQKTDDKVRKICSVSVPYSVVRDKGFDVFPVELPKDVNSLIQDSMTFMSAHEDVKQVQKTPKKVPSAFEDIAEKDANGQTFEMQY